MLTLFGSSHAGTELVAASLEIFTPGGAGTWSAPKALPFNYFYYPWTFLLPGGDLFDLKLQLTQLRQVTYSEAAMTSLAENYTGLPLPGL